MSIKLRDCVYSFHNWGQFYHHFLSQSESGTVLHKIVAKCVKQHKNCNLKYAIKFQQTFWWNRTTSYGPFTLCWHLWALHRLVGEINFWSLNSLFAGIPFCWGKNYLFFNGHLFECHVCLICENGRATTFINFDLGATKKKRVLKQILEIQDLGKRWSRTLGKYAGMFWGEE